MAHATPRVCRHPGDEPADRLLDLRGLHEGCRLLLGRTADLADHDDALGLVVGQEHLQHLDEVGAVDRIAADADAGRLAEPRSEEHTSELQSLMRISYAVFCLKKKNKTKQDK